MYAYIVIVTVMDDAYETKLCIIVHFICKWYELLHSKHVFWHKTYNVYWFVCAALENDHDTAARSWYDNRHVARRTRRSRAVQFKGNVSITVIVFFWKPHVPRAYYIFMRLLCFLINSKLKMCTSRLRTVQYFKRLSSDTTQLKCMTWRIPLSHFTTRIFACKDNFNKQRQNRRE